MTQPETITISGAVEGIVDRAVLERIASYVGQQTSRVYVAEGKQRLLRKLNAYNHAARYSPWLVLVDLDLDGECAPALRKLWLPEPAPLMMFTIAVRAVEAWLLADRHRIATFLGVTESSVPGDPEALDNPKHTLVQLAQRSRRRNIRKDFVPRPGSGRSVGPGYSSRLIEFIYHVAAGWRPEVAAERSPSLHRVLARLQAV